MMWCLRILVTASLFVPAIGCRSMSRADSRGLGRQMSELQAALDNREITLDEYERSKQAILLASPQRPATNAR